MAKLDQNESLGQHAGDCPWTRGRRGSESRRFLNGLVGVILIMTVTRDMKIADVLKKYPSTKKVLQKHIPACIKCGGASAESIERGARMHGIEPETLVKELNRAAKPRRKK